MFIFKGLHTTLIRYDSGLFSNDIEWWSLIFKRL